jgi:hypothetical protein
MLVQKDFAAFDFATADYSGAVIRFNTLEQI